MALQSSQEAAITQLVPAEYQKDEAPAVGEKEYYLNGRYLVASDSNYIGIGKSGQRIDIPCPGQLILEHRGRIYIPSANFFNFMRMGHFRSFMASPVFFSRLDEKILGEVFTIEKIFDFNNNYKAGDTVGLLKYDTDPSPVIEAGGVLRLKGDGLGNYTRLSFEVSEVEKDYLVCFRVADATASTGHDLTVSADDFTGDSIRNRWFSGLSTEPEIQVFRMRVETGKLRINIKVANVLGDYDLDKFEVYKLDKPS